MAIAEKPTVGVSNIPQSIVAKDLLDFLESRIGSDSVFAVEILTERSNWKSRGFGRVQFTSLEAKSLAISLSLQNKLNLKSHYLKFYETHQDIIARPVEPRNRVDNAILHVGFMVKEDQMTVLESWEGVRAWVMPERSRVEFWVWQGQECYKMEIVFEDILAAVGYALGGEKLNALLLKVKYGPKIYQRKAGPGIASNFDVDRYHVCKEDYEFSWVRTTDFSEIKSIGQCTSFCWELEEEPSASDIFHDFPFYREEEKELILEDGEEFSTSSEIVPLVKCGSNLKLPYEIFFQLNSLVHTQKISLSSVDGDLASILSRENEEIIATIFQKLHKLKSTCYDPHTYVKTQLHLLKGNFKGHHSSSRKNLKDDNIMICHRGLITPTKIYCLGPELETSNYVVKNFAIYASDFMRITFVEEDWTKLPANAVSTFFQKGLFSKRFRTKIYHRILSILQHGIVIGDKKFEFLAFSASQLRSNSVWMFASNENVKAEEIREWMGCFKKIRSISKCAARMGQLFSSSMQTLMVPLQDVEIIPDIKTTTNDVSYCFSDGIGKISLSFAKQVAQKCGLTDTPSAFQIRYGGYKGVIAVDRHSFRKLSLRSSMLKFESKNRMLNITKWSDAMPCFLNREIIGLLSTLGVKDEVFEEMQQTQLCLLGEMRNRREAALNVLQNLSGMDSSNILVMLLQHYEPKAEPYLAMMLQAQYEIQLSDLKSRCRIFVSQGRILVGCLDESGILDYGQVFVRVTMKKSELLCNDESLLRKVDEQTCVIVGKVIVTRNPCLHPGDIRVLEAVYDLELEEKGMKDCLIFPQRGERPHPNECSGGDLDGDLYFISWDRDLIPCQTEAPMEYISGRPRIMDHDVTLEEIQQFFVDYMINDTLGAISTAHLVHADREPTKAKSPKCLELANLHSMAVDFAKTGAPAEMPKFLKPRVFPDFMERVDKPMYVSNGVLGKLYRAIVQSTMQERSNFVWSENIAEAAYDRELEVNGFDSFIETAEFHREMYVDKISSLMTFYGAESEEELLVGNLRNRASYLQRDNRRYGDMKDRILLSVKRLQKEAKEWFENSCEPHERQQMASAWYHVTYHPSFYHEGLNCLSFPWIVGNILLNIKTVNGRRARTHKSIYENDVQVQ